jgi:quercetin dioxygenase-like cupin family protein
MHVTARDQVIPYDAPKHFSMTGYRLQGGDVSAFRDQVGLSFFAPGGGAEHSASNADRVYVLVSGELVVTTQGQKTVLREFDSCYIPAGQERSLANESSLPAVIVTIIAPS